MLSLNVVPEKTEALSLCIISLRFCTGVCDRSGFLIRLFDRMNATKEHAWSSGSKSQTVTGMERRRSVEWLLKTPCTLTYLARAGKLESHCSHAFRSSL